MAQSLYRQASLIMNPYGAKDDLLPSIKPTNGDGDFTFSRDGSGASPATRVNASGYIEKGRENVLTYSNDFGGADWTAVNASITTGQSGYDGSSDASLLTATSANANIYQLNSTTGVLSFSVYAKAGTAGWVRLRLDNTSSTDVNTWVNLSDGSIGSDNGIATNVESIGSGWYRITSQVNTTDLNNVRIYPADSDGNNSTSGNIYIQDAQLESGLVATDYIETTTAPVSAGLLGDMPRLDYSGGATCPSLLLEPSRVNLVPNSEYFSASEYTLDAITATANATTSPEGIANATEITRTSASGNARLILSNRVVSSGAKVTISIFAKANTASDIILYNTASTQGKRFDLSTGTAGDDFVTAPDDFDIEDYGNGWYRCWIVVTAPSTIMNSWIYIVDSATSSVYMYGQQMEEGSYPTSYIPTYGSAAPRAADDCDIINAPSLMGQTEGTAYVEMNHIQGTESLGVFMNDGSGSNYSYLVGGYISSGNIPVFVVNNSVGQVSIQGTSQLSSGTHKLAIAYKQNDFALYVDGVQIGTDSSGTLPALNDLYIGQYKDNIGRNGTKKQVVLFKTRLTNAELASLTTL